jgi:glycosyltransferase involved in cell wall biosynthesis
MCHHAPSREDPPGAASRVAVVIPCYNEEPTIGKVIDDFRLALPNAQVYVFDNNSTDRSAQVAHERQAQVIRVRMQGKGYVVASIFQYVDADYYVMVDGDDTYPAEDVDRLMAPLLRDEADMVVGSRLKSCRDTSFRRFHVLGNRLVCGLINAIFRMDLSDVMSGYRAFNRDVISFLPIAAEGFEVETQMTALLLYYRFRIVETELTDYRPRPRGSASKLRTFQDGAKVLLEILNVLKAYKPLTFFGSSGLLMLFSALGLGFAVAQGLPQARVVTSVALSVVSSACALLAVYLIGIGVTIHTFNYRLKELYFLLWRLYRGERGRSVH